MERQASATAIVSSDRVVAPSTAASECQHTQPQGLTPQGSPSSSNDLAQPLGLTPQGSPSPKGSLTPRGSPRPLAAFSSSAQLALVVIIGLAICFLSSRAILDGHLASRSTPAIDPRLDLNEASVAELALLPGVGPTLAERIDDHRRTHGPFRSVDDLLDVPGIGPRTLERLRDKVVVSQSEARTNERPQARPAAKTYPKATKPSQAIDPNTATLAELDTLPGIGPVLAQRIVDERANRPFSRAEDLRRVKGIGPKTLEKVRPFVIFAKQQIAAGK